MQTRDAVEILFIYFLIEIDVLSTRSGQSYLLLANENAHLTTHEPIKICFIKVKIKLKFVASVSEPRVDDGDFAISALNSRKSYRKIPNIR